MKCRCRFLSFMLFILLLLLPMYVYADLGPKPSLDIMVRYNGEPITDDIFYAKMLSCRNDVYKYEKLAAEIGPYNESRRTDWLIKCESVINKYGFDDMRGRDAAFRKCYDVLDTIINPPAIQCNFDDKNICERFNLKILDEANECYWIVHNLAWGGECKDSACHFTYFLPSNFKIALYIPRLNKLFITNNISLANFRSNYQVDILPDGSAKIIEKTSFFQNDEYSLFFKAFFITLLLELIAGLVFVNVMNISYRFLVSIIIVNVISLPIVWYIFPLFGTDILTTLLLSEIFAVVFEAYSLFVLNKRTISLKKLFSLSVIMNSGSLFFGFFILILLNLFI